MEALVQQMITAGSGEMQQNAAETVQRIETAVAAICNNSSVKAEQQMENALTNHGASVKGAILNMSQKEAEVQRHLANIFSEMSEIRCKINNDLPALHWQLQQMAGGTSGVVATSDVMVIQRGEPDNTGSEMEVQASVPAEESSVAAAVADAVMAAVGVPAAAGDEDLNTPPREKDEVPDAGVLQDVGPPSADVDPDLLDQPCEAIGW